MRALFKTDLGDKFIDEAVQATVTLNISGLNVDWEPTTDATEEDARLYATYLDRFAKRMVFLSSSSVNITIMIFVGFFTGWELKKSTENFNFFSTARGGEDPDRRHGIVEPVTILSLQTPFCLAHLVSSESGTGRSLLRRRLTDSRQ